MSVASGHFTRDSIVGTLDDGKRFAVPRYSLWHIEERRVSAPKTVKAVVVGAAIVGTSLLFLLLAALEDAGY